VSALVIAADVGGIEGYHAGDEAMLAANLAALRALRPDVACTVISRDPEWTAAHYGVQAIAGCGSGATAERLHALAAADALIISGAGHLCSRWPEHIHDRATLIRLAHQLGKPVVVLGQTIGPELTGDDRETLAGALALASMVGVRGRESSELVRALGIAPAKIAEHLDDAWFLDPVPSAAAVREAGRRHRPWVAVTLAPLAGDPATFLPLLRSLGRQFSHLARTLDADLVFLPHWNASQGIESDAVLARRLFGFLDEPRRATLLPVLSGEDICWLTRQASLVVSSRYHPIVFGLSGGIPSVAISPDAHTRVRHAECLRQAGLEHLAISLDTARQGGLEVTARSAWEQRETIRHHLHARTPGWRADDARKWSRVCDALGWPAPQSRVRPHAEPSQTISAVVLTKDGADRLEPCLQSIIDAGIASELLVFVDQTTTDASETIARRFTPNVVRVDTQGALELTLAQMVAACSGDFVLRVDDDETLGGGWDLPVDFANRWPGVTHFSVPRRWVVAGQDAFLSSGDWFPDLQVRLFRNDPSLIRWPAILHDHVTVQGAGGVLWDRWIDHHVLWQQSRAAREHKCEAYRITRPDKHLSHFYLWEEQAVRLSPCRPDMASAAEPLPSGAVVTFEAGGTSAPYTLDGWSGAEPWGTWTDGHRAVLGIPLKQPPQGPVEVVLEANAFLRPQHPVLHVCVSCNHTVVAEWEIRTADVCQYPVRIPAELMAGQGVLQLSLDIKNPASPHELGESLDTRPLGLGLRRLRIDYR